MELTLVDQRGEWPLQAGSSSEVALEMAHHVDLEEEPYSAT